MFDMILEGEKHVDHAKNNLVSTFIKMPSYPQWQTIRYILYVYTVHTLLIHAGKIMQREFKCVWVLSNLQSRMTMLLLQMS